jgi:vancomycin permeability regulator SanA
VNNGIQNIYTYTANMMYSFKKKMVLVAFGALLLLSMMTIAGAGLLSGVHYAPYAVVFGNTVEADGAPSQRLQARLDRVVVLYRENLCDTIIVSGGIGKEGFNEAAVMAAYLQKQGIPGTSITEDSLGVNSHATAVHSKQITGDTQSIIAVSQYFHLPRCILSLKNNGFTRVYGAYPLYFELRDIYSVFREVPGILHYVFLKL